jgi:hypothetical protein
MFAVFYRLGADVLLNGIPHLRPHRAKRMGFIDTQFSGKVKDVADVDELWCFQETRIATINLFPLSANILGNPFALLVMVITYVHLMCFCRAFPVPFLCLLSQEKEKEKHMSLLS